jgi:hypothetical protein
VYFRPRAAVLYGSPVRAYVLAIAWVVLGALLYAFQILSLATR